MAQEQGAQPQKAYRDSIYPVYAKEFQGAAETFNASAATRWGRAYDYYFRKWLPPSKDARILDLGCGNGALLHFFIQRRFSSVRGVDVSAQQVNLAKQVTKDVECSDVFSFLQGRNSQFDLITGLDILEHLQKDEVLMLLKACYSALAPGGRLIVQTVNADSPFSAAIRYGDFTHEIAFNLTALSNLLKFVGFQGAAGREVGPVPYGLSIANTVRSIVWEFIRSTIKLWNLAETGSSGSQIFTRNFLMSAIRK